MPTIHSFYALTHCGQFIDEILLQKGLYVTNIPKLYSKETTIDKMIQQARTVVDITGNQFIEESYFENLSKCKLTEVQLSILE